MKVCFLTILPVPYMQETFAALSRTGAVEVSVLYLEAAAPDTHWGARPLGDYESILPGHWAWFFGGRVHWNPGVLAALRDADADVYVVAGYAGLTNQIAMWWLRRHRRRWVMQAETSGMRRRGWLAGAVRAVARRPAVRWPDAIAAIGSRAAEDYRRLAAAGGGGGGFALLHPHRFV